MPRQLFTAEDIRRLSHEKTETLVLGLDDIITHEASDVAYALGVKVIRETGSGLSLKKEPLPATLNLPPLKVVRMATSMWIGKKCKHLNGTIQKSLSN